MTRGTTYDAAISGKGKHHPGITGHGEQATMPHADDDQAHQHHGTVVAKDVDEDLQHGLPVGAGDGPVEVLDAEEEAEEHEEAEQRAETDRADHADGCAPGSLPCLLGEVRRRIEARQCVL